MLDSQYEGIVEMLEKIYNNLTGVIVLIAFLWLTTSIILIFVFFASYDKEQDRKRKDDDARIRRIIEEYKRDESH